MFCALRRCSADSGSKCVFVYLIMCIYWVLELNIFFVFIRIEEKNMKGLNIEYDDCSFFFFRIYYIKKRRVRVEKKIVTKYLFYILQVEKRDSRLIGDQNVCIYVWIYWVSKYFSKVNKSTKNMNIDDITCEISFIGQVRLGQFLARERYDPRKFKFSLKFYIEFLAL